MQNCPALLAWYLITPTTHRVKSITAARVEISFWQTRIMESSTRNTFSDSSRCVQIIHNDYIKIQWNIQWCYYWFYWYYEIILLQTMKLNTTYFETQHETCIKNLWKTTTKNIKMKLTPFLTETVTTQEMKIDTETIKVHQKEKKNQPESDKLL